MKCFQPVYIIRYFLPKVKFIFARVGFRNGWNMARACPSPCQTGAGFTRFTRFARLGAGDCSSGSPDPERRRIRRSCPTEGMRARVPQGTARDRPSPYDKRHVVFTVARGPVPRDRPTRAKNARQPRQFLVPIEAWRGTGPRPTVKERQPCLSAYGPKRDCSSGSPDPERRKSRCSCPTEGMRSRAQWHGEGQALALR